MRPELTNFNPDSYVQMQQLLFAPYIKGEQTEGIHFEEEFDQEDEIYEDEVYEETSQGEKIQKPVNVEKVIQQSEVEKELEIPETRELSVINTNWPQIQPRLIKITIKGLGLKPVSYTKQGTAQVDAKTLKKLSGNNPSENQFGTAFDTFLLKGYSEEEAKEACLALDSFLQYKKFGNLLSLFILPLMKLQDQNNRIHCSINLNTETGRISAKKPNLLNQPSLDKDVIKLREVFKAQKGNKLIVADYEQLELRVLAHVTKCQDMIQTFKQGGDFHSRTAIDQFGIERRKAKKMNYSIAYGQSTIGFSKEWKCSVEEANNLIELWLAERQEVSEWQQAVHYFSISKGYTKTLLGRYRNHTPFVNKKRNYSLRAAVNSPIQGSAADLVVAAMVKLHYDEYLKKELKYDLILQSHNEVILEGPEENAVKAQQRIKEIMEKPLDNPLLIDLEVNSKIVDNWHQAE